MPPRYHSGPAGARGRSVTCAVPRQLRALITVTIVLLFLGAPACGLRHHTIAPRKGTLIITPPAGKPATPFMLTAGGFRPGEAMTFEIDGPNKARFVGPSHTADPTGMVASTYKPLSTDPPGPYTVLAVGNQGTRAQGTLTVTP